MTPQVEFFFDCASPWSYIAFHRIQPLAESAGFDIVWRPVLVGGVFNEVNRSVYEFRANPEPAKWDYIGKDIADWAAHTGLRIRWQPSVFPVNSVRAMRGCLYALEQGCLPEYARRVFQAYWGDDSDISQADTLTGIVASLGLPADAFFDYIDTAECKQALRANTRELIDRGGFGVPTMFVGGEDMYFGNDRLPLVEAAVRREHA